MAKAKKRVVTRKKTSKTGRASAKPVRRKVAKRAAPKKPPLKTATKIAPGKKTKAPIVEDTIVDVIDEPIPGVVRVTEYETIRVTTPGGAPAATRKNNNRVP